MACSQPKTCADAAQIRFTYSTAPFAFNISHAHMGDVLLTTVGHPLIFEPQFLRIMTTLPRDVNIYGLGEHSEPFRLDMVNTMRTLWACDTYGICKARTCTAATPSISSIVLLAACTLSFSSF